MSRAGWKIPKRVDVLNITAIEFNRKWEQIQILQVKSGLFLLSLRYIAWLDEKLNLREFNWNLKFFVFNKMLMPVSDVSVSAVYDLPSMYFTSFACSVGTTKFCQ